MIHLISSSLAGVHVNPFYALAGLLVGALVGLTGVGGGSLMTPILVLLFGIHPATAVGTDLLYAAITKGVGTAIHGSRRTVDWRVVGLLTLGSVPATLLTLFGIAHCGKSAAMSSLITHVLGYALFLTAIMLLLRGRIRRYAERQQAAALAEGADESKLHARRIALTIMVGLLLGFLVSLSSVGAGALGVTALILLYPQLPTVKIVGSDIAHAVPLTFLAGAGYFFLGKVEVSLLISLLIGSLPGIILGSLLAPRVPEKVLRIVLATVLSLVGIKLVTG
ncbi:sulfite exporter TauE/SafE family protein [Asticcacaulis sp. EMRT-3]|uniref:sulfite exporter TauE/SafE family protein n=1 Tax=Asticcacaulis sp. EMRT-3 TaxID=3040349 RepID=UPI0024AFD2B2|nr:sulfite exporter TauE/SafE family protein [Asticcacaulis sp. EMRT-3]MDI7775699.1 sulfite exporter TauE/SafE family protein [Asticcacaulis sp. EMRT-3]